MTVLEDFPSKGRFHLRRMTELQTFTCRHCGKEKTSKLVAIVDEDENKRLCNGCYGQILAGKATHEV